VKLCVAAAWQVVELQWSLLRIERSNGTVMMRNLSWELAAALTVPWVQLFVIVGWQLVEQLWLLVHNAHRTFKWSRDGAQS
jgi:hypothetical protein